VVCRRLPPTTWLIPIDQHLLLLYSRWNVVWLCILSIGWCRTEFMPMISTSVPLFSLSFLPETSCIDYSGAILFGGHTSLRQLWRAPFLAQASLTLKANQIWHYVQPYRFDIKHKPPKSEQQYS
jgi:hypothetical protein